MVRSRSMQIHSKSQNPSQSSNLNTSDVLVFEFPFPTSVNESLAAVGGRLVKTSKARHFLASAIMYAKTHREFREYRHIVADWINKRQTIRVDCVYVWPKSRIFTKESNKEAKSWVRQIDAHNRNKQLHDAIAEVFGEDDKYFFAGDTEKVYDESFPECEPYCLVKMTPHKPRSIQQVRESLNV